MAYWYYAMCHNPKPFKLEDKDPLSNFKTKLKNLFQLPHVIM